MNHDYEQEEDIDGDEFASLEHVLREKLRQGKISDVEYRQFMLNPPSPVTPAVTASTRRQKHRRAQSSQGQSGDEDVSVANIFHSIYASNDTSTTDASEETARGDGDGEHTVMK